MKLEIEVQGKVYTLHAENIRGQIWIHHQGRNFLYVSQDQQNQKNKSKKHSHAGDIIAPMPGKVTKILKQKGDSVSKGDAVLVMEAMKMEYTLKSDGDGTVESVLCQIGEQVVLGKLLAHIKPTSINDKTSDKAIQ